MVDALATEPATLTVGSEALDIQISVPVQFGLLTGHGGTYRRLSYRFIRLTS